MTETIDTDSISDGYHTFGELYAHRTVLFACLCNLEHHDMSFKSWHHSDGTMYDGYFIAGIYADSGWVTYHCEAKYWDMFHCVEYDLAPEWDGATPNDGLMRLVSQYAWPYELELPND